MITIVCRSLSFKTFLYFRDFLWEEVKISTMHACLPALDIRAPGTDGAGKEASFNVLSCQIPNHQEIHFMHSFDFYRHSMPEIMIYAVISSGRAEKERERERERLSN